MDVQELYKLRLNESKGSAQYWAKVKKGVAKYEDAYAFADGSSAILMEQMLSVEGLTMEQLEACLIENSTDILDAAAALQKKVNQAGGFGLNPVDLEPDLDRILGLVKHVDANGGLQESDAASVNNLARSNVDRTIRENADFQYRSGCNVTVSRKYDGVGLKAGACKWCLDRAGSNVPYPEALAMGMFERHEGCGCVIEYHTERGSYWQTDWTRNRWELTSEESINRRTYGI